MKFESEEIVFTPITSLLSQVIDNRGRTCPTAEKGIPLIATNCIGNENLYPVKKNIRYVSLETYNTWFRGHPEPGDVIFVNKGTPGRVCLVPDPIDFCIAQDMVTLRVNKHINNLYLLAALRAPQVQSQIQQMQVGTMIPHFKKADFEKLLIPMRDMPTQVAIGKIYFELSQKIDLNERTSKTLESIAQTIFKSWFIDFDPVKAKMAGENPAGMDVTTAALFPDTMEDSELGLIPTGWPISKLESHLKVTKGKSYKSSELEQSDTALVTLKSFKRGGGYRFDGLKSFSGEFKPEQVINAGDLIVSFTDVTQAADVIGKPAIVMTNPAFSTLVASLDVGIVRATNKNLGINYLYQLFSTPIFKNHIDGYTNGTTVLHLGKGALEDFVVPLPDETLMTKYESFASSIISKLQTLYLENLNLEQIRDSLLPRLISGELEIPKEMLAS